MTHKILEISKLSLPSANGFRLHNLNLSINQGEKVAIIGKSGSGKSSLFSAINGSIKSIRGTIKWKGKDVHKLTNRQRSEISTIWQDLRLLEDLSVSQNINCGTLYNKSFLWSIYNLFATIDNVKCLSYLQGLDLAEYLLYISVKNLSGGQRQRVAIARALSQSSELLLADEPYSSLDPILSDKIIDIILGISEVSFTNIPSTIIMALHNLDYLNKFSRIING